MCFQVKYDFENIILFFLFVFFSTKIFTLSCHVIFLSLFYFLGGFPIVIDGDGGTFFSLEEIIGKTEQNVFFCFYRIVNFN